jgi:outer membrane protein assembly factor BamD (BamD/ComL family)/predicted Ser/Thr protein kinase
MKEEQALVGKVLGNRYRVLREIGSGGMAWVYLAEDNRDNKLVAVKILYPQFGEDLSYIQRFNREARLASTLTDPHIVRVLDYGADRDLYYLVMEYVEGRDLRELLNEKGSYGWQEALEIIDQLATALEHAHLHQVVHRDIKPQNVMINDDGLLKVLDFGIARISTLPSLTQSGFIGSPYYVSPEQAMGEEVDIRSDIYSSGIVLYELLSGKIPFDAKSPWSIISQHIAHEPPPIELADASISPTVQQLMARMIAKRPADRFQTPSALRQAVAAVLAGKPIPPDDVLDAQSLSPTDRVAMAENLYQRALEAMKAEEWVRAIDLLSQTLNLDPHYAGAGEAITRAKDEARLNSLYNTARQAMQKKYWEDAVKNLETILEISPKYKDTEAQLKEARQNLAVSSQKFTTLPRSTGSETSPAPTAKNDWWRWSLVAIGIIVIILMSFVAFSRNAPPPAAQSSPTEDALKALYTQAQQAIADGEQEKALALLEQILAENPNYADAAQIRRDLLATPTPLAAEADPLAQQLDEIQTAVDSAQWTQAIEMLQAVRATDADYEAARVSSLLCDAYVGRGLEAIANITPEAEQEAEAVEAAQADFEAGAAECPRRVDLRDQAKWAQTYLEALATPPTDHDALIKLLTPIVAAEPNYAGGNAKNLLYRAYLGRGDARRDGEEFAGALSDYEAALDLNVADPSEAQTRRAESLLAFSRPTPIPAPAATPTSVATVQVIEGVIVPTATPTPTPGLKYGPPTLLGPPDDAFFAGKLFADLYLEWDPLGPLAEDEYYDLTVMHIFADQPNYWGVATKETRYQLNPDIGLGRAGGDRFYWWVTVRKANSASSTQKIDVAMSEQSEIRTFVWVP